MIPAGTPLGAITVQLGASPIIGQVAPAGQLIKLGSLAGWWDQPASSGESTQKVNDHGSWLSPGYYGPRIVALTAYFDGFSPGDSMAQAKLLLREVPVDGLTTLTVTDEAEALMASVRQEGDPILVRTGNRVSVSLSLLAPDPRRYSPASSVSTGLPSSTGGLSLPLVLPLSLGGSITAGSFTVTNFGDIDTWPVFTVSGPIAPFTITDSSGHQLVYSGSIGAGRQLIIDTAAKTASQDGQATRVVTGTWPRLVPGVNTFSFQASAYDPASLLTMTYRSARR